MQLLHITAGTNTDELLEIILCESLRTDIPPYAILSHRWREDEVFYADMAGPNHSNARQKSGYSNRDTICRIALREGFRYVLSDTCCINKTSSAELLEAINSMHSYYSH